MSAFAKRESSLREMLIAYDYLSNYVSRNKKLPGSRLPDEAEDCWSKHPRRDRVCIAVQADIG